ncbi:hypothetical protein D6825_03810 [Candidatus Woesearchaeota archaeon]|nr:MAG: hypothetical protein D6825_03810 [Candidatus Woesearchaeota archaeon]
MARLERIASYAQAYKTTLIASTISGVLLGATFFLDLPESLAGLAGSLAATYTAISSGTKSIVKHQLARHCLEAYGSYFILFGKKEFWPYAKLCAFERGELDWYKFEKSTWDRIEEVHNNYGMKSLIRRKSLDLFVRDWAISSGRVLQYLKAVEEL